MKKIYPFLSLLVVILTYPLISLLIVLIIGNLVQNPTLWSHPITLLSLIIFILLFRKNIQFRQSFNTKISIKTIISIFILSISVHIVIGFIDFISKDISLIKKEFFTFPRLIYGFSGFINYKRFEFSFSFQGSGKRTFFVNPSAISPFVGNHAMLTAIYNDHWSEDNMATRPFWPRLSPQNITAHNPQENWYAGAETRKSTYFMRECSFLRCTSIQLAYNMPRKLLNKWRMQNMRQHL